VESHRATWARFSSRPRALQTKRRHRHGSFCRSKRARHAAAPTQFVWGRGVASCDVGQFFKPPKGSSDPAPATAWRPRRSKLCKTRCRAVHRCVASVESHRATWASFSSRPRARQTKRRQRHGALCRRKRARYAVSVQDTLPRRHSLLWGAVSLHATWASFSGRPRALQTQRRQRHGALAAVSVQDTLPCRPQAFG
jgi:hypothetical protein